MKQIGSGSFGKVFYGLWFGTPVAVKVSSPWLALEDAMGGGGTKRGQENLTKENLTKDTPPQTGFGPRLHLVLFPPPSGVVALFFLFRKARNPEKLEYHRQQSCHSPQVTLGELVVDGSCSFGRAQN